MEGKKAGFLTTLWISIEFISVQIADTLMEYVSVMRRELELFLGSGLLLIGFFNWSSGKYCDGNTADYLACTNPVTYYYYDAFAIGLIVVGAFLTLIWLVKNRKA